MLQKQDKMCSKIQNDFLFWGSSFPFYFLPPPIPSSKSFLNPFKERLICYFRFFSLQKIHQKILSSSSPLLPNDGDFAHLIILSLWPKQGLPQKKKGKREREALIWGTDRWCKRRNLPFILLLNHSNTRGISVKNPVILKKKNQIILLATWWISYLPHPHSVPFPPSTSFVSFVPSLVYYYHLPCLWTTCFPRVLQFLELSAFL